MQKLQLAYKRLQRYLDDFEIVDESKFMFNSIKLKFLCKQVNFDLPTTWDIETQRLLIKCCRPLNCYPATAGDKCFILRKFTLQESDEQFDYLYHSTDTPPEIILKEGLKLRYSFRLHKGFPPLIFLSTDKRNWLGKYKYQIKLHQKIYFDTNLNHQCRKGNNFFCVLQNIKSEDITLFSVSDT